MDDIKALVLKNEFGLDQSKVMSLVTQINARQAGYLSPDKEAGLFLLFVTGKTIQDIVTETSFPLDTVLLTAIYYRWHEKAEALGLTDPDKSVEELQKDLLKSVLVATTIATRKQLGDVIAGRADANKSGLIPKSIQALGQLMSAIESLKPKTEGVSTNITAQNVQIVNSGQSQLPPADKMSRLRLIAEQKKRKNV